MSAALARGDLDTSCPLHAGIDIGSKTVKLVLQDDAGEIAYASYDRHLSNVKETVLYVLRRAERYCPDGAFSVGVTGSAGMRLAEILGVPFIQEVVACRSALDRLLPDADVAIEIGGEDSKILFVTGGEELRMNSTCAGGTGGFIDTIAGMLDINAEKLNYYAHGCKTIYPIASRCAVFAQMDVRPLVNEGVSREDIAGSAIDAVVTQCITGLACGRPIRGKVAMLGGPLHFLSALRKRFADRLGLADADVLVPSEGHLFVAQGAAFEGAQGPRLSIIDLRERIEAAPWDEGEDLPRLAQLFSSREEHARFVEEHARCTAPRTDIGSYEGRAYLGVDSGSEAIKYALVAEDGSILRTYYKRSAGNLVEQARDMLVDLYKHIPRDHAGEPTISIAHAAVTGYGEHYLSRAFSFDSSEVETVCHVRATQELVPDADFILDIGGQDIKCVYLEDGLPQDIVLNEACSSGCGALLSGMAWSMNVRFDRFLESALYAENPVDLGTRCTVFMTSRVRHAQKEGASLGDISAGLAYSVVRNAIYKVIRARDIKTLGNSVVVQGGTFCNDAVLRAFENACGGKVSRPDIAAYMGAYGAALIARTRGKGQKTSGLLNRVRVEALTYDQEVRACSLCPNACKLIASTFSDGGDERSFTVGNRCARGAGDEEAARDAARLPDLFSYRARRVFEHKGGPGARPERGTVGIVRALDMYELFPFWRGVFESLGVEIVLSEGELSARALQTIPSESICYPAKLAHGHLAELFDRGVERVFMPYVASVVAGGSACPVTRGYPLVLKRNVVAPSGTVVRCIMPEVLAIRSSADPRLPDERLERVLFNAFSEVWPDIDRREITAAVEAGISRLNDFESDMRAQGTRALRRVRELNARAVVLAGRPYHVDPAVHHGIPDLLRSCGYGVLTDDSLPGVPTGGAVLPETPLLGWEYPERVLAAASFAAENDDVDLVELYSFGCGIDAVTTDAVKDAMRARGGVFAALKIDEMVDLAATRIRIRSMKAVRDGVLGVRSR